MEISEEDLYALTGRVENGNLYRSLRFASRAKAHTERLSHPRLEDLVLVQCAGFETISAPEDSGNFRERDL